MRFRKKPVVVEAAQFTDENHEPDGVRRERQPWPDDAQFGRQMDAKYGPMYKFFVDTLEGPMEAKVGDWIITNVKGEKYPCKPDIFELTYEPVPEPAKYRVKLS